MMYNRLEMRKLASGQKEESLHIAICDYLRAQYPDVIFTSESSGVRLTIGQAKKAKRMRSGSKLPDIWILEPRHGLCGLFLEVKKESPITNKLTYKTPHIAEQAKTMERLYKLGYHAQFVWSFDMAKQVIDNYME